MFLPLIPLILACGNTGSPPESVSAEKIPNSVLVDADITLMSQGHREAVIFADTLYVFDKEDSTLAKKVKVDFYDENGGYRSTLTSSEGLVRQKKKEFSVWGDVVVESDSSTLQTESLYWNPITRLITTDDYVKLIRTGDIVTGYGMEADSRLEHVRILRDVKGEIINLPSGEEEIDILEGDDSKEILP